MLGFDLLRWARFPHPPPIIMAKQLVDYFGNLIELGDAYFYGAPPTAGKVVEIHRSYIVLEYPKTLQKYEEATHSYVDTETIQKRMKCGSPDRGVCLDKKGFV